MTKGQKTAQAWLSVIESKSALSGMVSRLFFLVIVFAAILLTVPVSGLKKISDLPKITAVYSTSPELSPAPPIPVKKMSASDLSIDAKGAIVVDTSSSAVLFEQNPDAQLLPASTTKIMTALVALDEYALGDIVTIDREEHTIGHTMNLVGGEKISVENLLYGLLVSSGNDAALALALSYPKGGYTGFIADMNKKAANLNLNQTTYKNVSGVESRGHLTTARDLAALAKEALKNPTFKKIVATQKIKLQSEDGSIVHDLETTNYLLGRVEGVTGVKTGWTENALECLVTSVERDGHQIIVVILGSSDRFGNTQKVIDWIYNSYDWQLPGYTD